MKRVAGVSNGGRRTEFGFSLPSRGPLARPEILARIARVADALRYSWVMVSDHIVLPTRNSAPYPYATTGEFPGGGHQGFLEPLTLMTWLLAVTKRLRVGVSVLVVPYRNPVVTAKQVATLDVLSGGRVILGAGVGWWPEEFEALSAPPFAQRGSVTDEYLRLMKELWTAEAPRFAGKHYAIGNVTMLPKPVQRPHPPIWIGGHSERAIRRAAELGDAWHPIGLRGPAGLAPDEMTERVRLLRERAARAGRDPKAVRVVFRARIEIWSGLSRRSTTQPARVRDLLCGPPAEVIADIRTYQQAGVDAFVFDFARPDPTAMIDTMTRFAGEIRPKVARAPRVA